MKEKELLIDHVFKQGIVAVKGKAVQLEKTLNSTLSKRSIST